MIAFLPDILQQTIYWLIPLEVQKNLHKRIGESLLESTVLHTAINALTNRLLGVDQINIFCKDGALTSEERSRFAISNAMGAKIAIAASNFEECEISQAALLRNMKH